MKHISFKPISVNKLLVVEVQSKGEKTTGEKEFVYVGTERLKDALKHDPETYVLGTEGGRRQKDFRRMWRELFKLAELKWERDKGLVSHTLRHEFCSRTAENTRILSSPRSWHVIRTCEPRRDTISSPIARLGCCRPPEWQMTLSQMRGV